MQRTAPRRTASHRTASHQTALHRTTPHRTTCAVRQVVAHHSSRCAASCLKLPGGNAQHFFTCQSGDGPNPWFGRQGRAPVPGGCSQGSTRVRHPESRQYTILAQQRMVPFQPGLNPEFRHGRTMPSMRHIPGFIFKNKRRHATRYRCTSSAQSSGPSIAFFSVTSTGRGSVVPVVAVRASVSPAPSRTDHPAWHQGRAPRSSARHHGYPGGAASTRGSTAS